MEEEFVQNQEILKPREERNQEERSQVDDLRGAPMGIGTLEEIIDDDHAIISNPMGPEYYVCILSIVDKDQLEPGCAVLIHQKVSLPVLRHNSILMTKDRRIRWWVSWQTMLIRWFQS